MSVKKGSPPPRPPAPKVGLEKLLKPSHNNSPSLSIRFKSLEEDDDEELTILDSAKPNGTKQESNDITIPESGKLSRFHAVSKSLDEDRLYSPSHRSPENNKEEKRTLLAGLKDKLSDKFPQHIDKINAISKKIEELSGDSASPNVSTLDNQVLDSTQQSKNAESLKTSQEKVAMSTSFSSPNLVQVYNSPKVNSVADDGVRNEIDSVGTPSRTRVPSIAEEGKNIVTDGIEIVDDFYCEEAFEDFNGSVNVPKDRLAAETSLRQRSPIQRSPIQRLIKNKNSADPQTKSKPMSMSSLMKNVSEEFVEYDGNVFFDPKDGAKLSPDNSNQTDFTDQVENELNQNPLSGLVDSNVPIKKLAVYGVCLFMYLILPLPSFLSGLVIGVILASLTWTIYLWITKPLEIKPLIKIEPLDDLPPMRVPEMRDLKPDDGKYKGWMNELFHYDPNNYHINQTHSVFLRLEGSVLRLSRPKMGVAKRAMWDESFPTPHFIHQRYLDLAGSRLYLLPPGLVEKRLWSKKYPLCIALANPANKERQSKGSDSSNPGDEDPLGAIVKEVSQGGAAKEVSGFEVITEQECENSVLYLFARTNREKEEWYYRLLGATRGRPLPNHLLEIMKALEFKPKHRRSQSDLATRHKRHNSTDSLSSLAIDESSVKDDVSPPWKADIGTFAQYMALLMPAEQNKKISSPSHVKKDSVKEAKEALKDDKSDSITCDPQLVWLNALLGRCFWDFLLQNYWKKKIQEKLEKKLSKIHVPYFIEELQVTDIDLGSTMPVIRRSSKPYLDERGFWVELDVAYDGGFRMTIETKLNLMRLKQTNKSKPESPTKQDPKRSAVTDSEEEDSAESSTDEEGEETPVTTGEDSAAQGGAGKKLLKYLDKITQSKYFQSATENKYIKKAMEGVSNTRLILTVELHALVGTMAINIPPPPSDRLWYGFRGNPKLRLVAKPKVGEREVTVTHVTEWIEKKLAIEFQRVFVMPNMDDLVIPLMMPGIAADSVPPQQRDNSSEV